jgi:hypothetical protein
MSTIFENSMATGKYAKGSNKPLGIDDVDHEAAEEEGNGVPTTHGTPATTTAATDYELGVSASATRPNKRAKTVDLDGDPLVVAFASSSDRLAKAIEKLAQGDMDLPPDLYTILKSLPDFNSVHISFYYAHLVANPHIGRAFYNLPSDANMDWVVGLSQRSFLKTSFTSYVRNLITFGFYMCTGN